MKTLFSIAIAVMLGACAGFSDMPPYVDNRTPEQIHSDQASKLKEDCNGEMSYQHGMNDGMAGAAMNQSQFQVCPESSRAELMRNYREGFNSGLQNRTSSAPPVQIQLGNGPSMTHRPYEKAFYCELTAFGKTIEAFGPTEFEAKRTLFEKCTSQHNKIFCDEPKCKLNQ